MITRLNAFDCVRLFVRVCVRSVYMQHPRVVVLVAPVRRAFAVRVHLPHVPVRADQRYRLRPATRPRCPHSFPAALPFPSSDYSCSCCSRSRPKILGRRALSAHHPAVVRVVRRARAR